MRMVMPTQEQMNVFLDRMPTLLADFSSVTECFRPRLVPGKVKKSALEAPPLPFRRA